MKLIYELCNPRPDVLRGAITESDFAADLAVVIRGEKEPQEYVDPVRFFVNTFPTRGLKALLHNVCSRLSGRGGEAAAIFRLDTSFGGGKTHGLIALVHAARGMTGVGNVAEFIDPALLPKGKVRVAAFDGENADPANGRAMGEGVMAQTPWGELAYALAGKPGFDRVRRSDEKMVAPGAETLKELFGGEPTLILLDELAVYLRKVQAFPGARDQLTAFLTSLFKAIESSPNAALVYTLAVGKDGRAGDAYSTENQFIAAKMAEAESVSARKATLLNPTEDDETALVLRRRLFERIDEAGAEEVIAAYRNLWQTHRQSLPSLAGTPETLESFKIGYPLHPDVLETLTGKTATLGNFQRVRGMLRLLARTVGDLWSRRPADAAAIHLHHVDPGHGPIHQELVTRLDLKAFVPAIRNDVSAEPGKRALAQEIDEQHYRGLAPYAAYVVRTILLHSFAFQDALKGLTPEHLRFSVLGPALDPSFIDDARKRFVEASAYLDDRPGVPLRFLAQANLTQIIRRQEQHVDPGELRAQLNDRIKAIFGGSHLELVSFPGGPYDVADDIGEGRPRMAVMSYDAVQVSATVDAIPELVERIFARKGIEGGSVRMQRNNLVFVVAEESRIEDMRAATSHRLALLELRKPERLADLADHQQAKIRELDQRAEHQLALAIQHCYRHLFYPARNRVPGASVELAHGAIDIHTASERPGSGQQQVVRTLRELKKLRTGEDEPDSPAYVRDRTPLKKGQITTAALRDEFRRDPSLPMLVGDEIFLRMIRKGIEQGEYVYRRGELLYGPGDPAATIQIDEQSIVFTRAYAEDQRIWPRRPQMPEPRPGDPPAPPSPSPAPYPEPAPSPITPVGEGTFTEEGPLREALAKLWERMRAKKIEKLKSLTIAVYEAGDAFRLLGVIGQVPGAKKEVVMRGGYETRDGATFSFEFQGNPADAAPVREFLDSQMRAAKDRTFDARYGLTFDGGLAMTGDAAEKLAERLTRIATGAVHVSATAEALP